MTCTGVRSAPHASPREELVSALAANQNRLLRHLTASCGLSGRAKVDLGQVSRGLRLRSAETLIALLGLQLAGKIRVEHSPERFETATITLPGGRD